MKAWLLHLENAFVLKNVQIYIAKGNQDLTKAAKLFEDSGLDSILLKWGWAVGHGYVVTTTQSLATPPLLKFSRGWDLPYDFCANTIDVMKYVKSEGKEVNFQWKLL